MSIKKLSEVPSEVAEFLELKDPHKYTSHSMRRTCATLLADGGSTALEITQFLGWKNVNPWRKFMFLNPLLVKRSLLVLSKLGPTFHLQ